MKERTTEIPELSIDEDQSDEIDFLTELDELTEKEELPLLALDEEDEDVMPLSRRRKVNPNAKIITPEERAAIDEFLRTRKVTICPPGPSDIYAKPVNPPPPKRGRRPLQDTPPAEPTEGDIEE